MYKTCIRPVKVFHHLPGIPKIISSVLSCIMATSHWESVFNRKSAELAKIRIPASTNIHDFTQFEAFLDDLCKRYLAKGVTKLVNEKLAPHFDHMRSFTNAVSSATQGSAYAALAWAGLQTALEVRFHRSPSITCARLIFRSASVALQNQLEKLSVCYSTYTSFCRISTNTSISTLPRRPLQTL